MDHAVGLFVPKFSLPEAGWSGNVGVITYSLNARRLKPVSKYLRMKTKLITLLAGLTVGLTTVASAKDGDQESVTRMTVELRDGSRLVGVPSVKKLPLVLDFASVSVPLAELRQCEFNRKDGRVVLGFQNGDQLTGRLEVGDLKLETSFGKVVLEQAQINRIKFSTSRMGDLPPGEGEISFGGVNWLGWKTMFEVRGDKVVSLPKVRPGFNYGHGGGGRGPMLISNIGNQDWRDYRIEADFCVTGVDSSFNPYGLGSDYQGGMICFHVAQAKENWNQSGNYFYAFRFGGDGTWDLVAVYNDYCATSMGYGNPHKDAERKLASGRGLVQDRAKGNRYRIEVRGQRIQLWVDDKSFVDVIDEKMQQPIGGKALDHGGVGFVGGFDAMFWMKNFSATSL